RSAFAVWMVGLLVCLGARAVELGTIGPTYPIAEVDFLEFIKQRLREKERTGELAKLEEQARTRSIESVRNPKPVGGLSPATSARTYYYDPTFVLDRNLLDEQGRLLFAAGTKKNPLEVVAMSKRLLFFDARDERQVARARGLIEQYGGKVKPILVGGSYLDLMKGWQTPVYYDQEGLLTKQLGITHVPAVVSQEGLRLRIDELVF